MGLNPFGDESDSEHAWKERFKQQQFQTQTLRSQLSQTKNQLEDLQIKFEEVSRQLKEREEELSKTKRELKSMRQISEDKNVKLKELESKLDTERIAKLEETNQHLMEQVENLQGQINRGGYSNDVLSTKDPSNLNTALIPMMLYEFDPSNSQYEDAFVNLVETVINEGDVLVKIVAILIKYGGNGPIDKLEEKVDSSEFDVALETLIESDILTKIDNSVFINTTDTVDQSDRTDLDTDELFTELLDDVETQSNHILINSLEEFRDILQEREIPLTTIFFEIRKTIERLEKGRLSRTDIKTQIKEWHDKYHALK